MSTYKVEYTMDIGTTTHVMTVRAMDYTKAYLSACYALPFETIILTVSKV